MATKFRIQIGDWSGDGHGKCDEFTVSSNKSLEEVREAYFAACKKLPEELCPENFVSEYQDSIVPDEVIIKATELGCKLFEGMLGAEYQDWHTEAMCDYVIWFIQQGDPEIKLKTAKSMPTLAFYGNDEKNRHISFIGYGLLGD